MTINKNTVNYLIGINIVIFLLLALTANTELADIFALYFFENPKFAIWQPFTHLFLHGGVAHLLFNMYALFAFGTVLENKWGKQKFLTFYFISGLGAAFIYSVMNYIQFNSIYDELVLLGVGVEEIQRMLTSGRVSNNVLAQISEERLSEFYSVYHSSAVGASGAIYGILIAYAITYPDAKLALIFLPAPIKARYFVPILIGADLFFGATRYSIGNIAHFAHIGGAVFGLIMMLWWRWQDKQKAASDWRV